LDAYVGDEGGGACAFLAPFGLIPCHKQVGILSTVLQWRKPMNCKYILLYDYDTLIKQSKQSL